MLLSEQAQKNPVTLPEIEGRDLLFRHPAQHALAAICGERAGKTIGGEKMHVFCVVVVVAESDDAAVAPAPEREPRFFAHLAQEAVVWRFAGFKFSANTDPLALVDIVVFLDAVQHQHRVVLFNVA